MSLDITKINYLNGYKIDDCVSYDIRLPDYAWKVIDMIAYTDTKNDDDCTLVYKSSESVACTIALQAFFRVGQAYNGGRENKDSRYWDKDCYSRMLYEIDNVGSYLEGRTGYMDIESRKVRFNKDFFNLFDWLFDMKEGLSGVILDFKQLENSVYCGDILSEMILWGLKRGVIYDYH